MRDQQGRECLRKARHMLRHVDQRDREIASGVQDGEAERADEHHVARGRGAVLPELDGPGQERDGQDHGDGGVKQPQLFEVVEAAPARRHLAVDRCVEPAVLAADAAESPDQRHVADHVDHLAVDRGGLVGEFVVERPTGGCEMPHGHHQDAGKHRQDRRHLQADSRDEPDRDRGRDAGRHHVPDEHVLQRVGGVGRGSDAAGQGAGHAIGKERRCMAGQMAEQVAAQIAGDADEGGTRDPAGQPPKQIIGRDQARKEQEPEPSSGGRSCVVQPPGQGIDQYLDTVLRPDRAADRSEDRADDRGMGQRAYPHITEQKRQGTISVPTDIFHVRPGTPRRVRTRHLPCNAMKGFRFHGNPRNKASVLAASPSTFVTACSGP